MDWHESYRIFLATFELTAAQIDQEMYVKAFDNECDRLIEYEVRHNGRRNTAKLYQDCAMHAHQNLASWYRHAPEHRWYREVKAGDVAQIAEYYASNAWRTAPQALCMTMLRLQHDLTQARKRKG